MAKPRDGSELISLTEAAARLGLRDERTVRRQLEQHGIPLVRLGRSVRIEPSAISALIEAARSPMTPAPKSPSNGNAKNRIAGASLPHRPATVSEAKRRERREPRRGWRQSFPNEPGLYRLHRVDCPASPRLKRQPKCDCRFYCHQPTGVPGRTSNRRLDARDLNEAKLEKKRVQGAGTSTIVAGISPTLTVRQFFKTVYLVGKVLSADSKRNYQSRFEHDLDSRIGSKRMRDVTLHEINLLVQELETDMVARRVELGRPNPRHVENRLTVVKSIFKYAHDIGYIQRNPTAGVKPPRGGVRQPGEGEGDDPQRILSEEQARALYAWGRRAVAAGGVEARKAIGLMLALAAALRSGEARGLWWSDIDLEAGSLVVRRQWKGGSQGFQPTKTHETRELALPEPLLDLLRVLYLEERERVDFSADDALVYIQSPTKPMSGSTLRAAFHKVQETLGVVHADGRPFRVHALRHTTATTMIRAGVPIAQVATFLGHSSTDVTHQVYTHLYAPDLRGAAAAIGAAIAGATPTRAEVRPATPPSVDDLIDEILGEGSPA
jgi:excisionase family DNA binding protein